MAKPLSVAARAGLAPVLNHARDLGSAPTAAFVNHKAQEQKKTKQESIFDSDSDIGCDVNEKFLGRHHSYAVTVVTEGADALGSRLVSVDDVYERVEKMVILCFEQPSIQCP